MLVVSGRVAAALTLSMINVVMPGMPTTIIKICAMTVMGDVSGRVEHFFPINWLSMEMRLKSLLQKTA
jgi:hypothetical protein